MKAIDWSQRRGLPRRLPRRRRGPRRDRGRRDRPGDRPCRGGGARVAARVRPGGRHPPPHLRRPPQPRRDRRDRTPAGSCGEPRSTRRASARSSGPRTESGSWSSQATSRRSRTTRAGPSSRARSRRTSSTPRSRPTGTRSRWSRPDLRGTQLSLFSDTAPVEAPLLERKAESRSAVRGAGLLSRRRVDPASVARCRPVAVRQHQDERVTAVADIARQFDADGKGRAALPGRRGLVLLMAR